jgi:predicted transcriptional regulator
VKVSSEMAGKLRKVAEVSGLSQETLAAEAIRRGIGVLTAFSNNQ